MLYIERGFCESRHYNTLFPIAKFLQFANKGKKTAGIGTWLILGQTNQWRSLRSKGGGHGASKWSVHVRDYLFPRNISCLVWLNIPGEAPVSIRGVAESAPAQGCCIRTWKQKLVRMLGNVSDLMLWVFLASPLFSLVKVGAVLRDLL